MFKDCTSILDVMDEITYGLERYVSGMERVSADKLGLDIRCGRVYIDRDERVIVGDSARSLDYYGGFEYIKEGEGRTTIGDYVIYNGDNRVEDCFDCLEEEVDAE
jgi:acyl-CoA reductase-like NAD-dependent aldehyde dehydrogenase